MDPACTAIAACRRDSQTACMARPRRTHYEPAQAIRRCDPVPAAFRDGPGGRFNFRCRDRDRARRKSFSERAAGRDTGPVSRTGHLGVGFFKEIVAGESELAKLRTKEHCRHENLPLESPEAKRVTVEFVRDRPARWRRHGDPVYGARCDRARAIEGGDGAGAAAPKRASKK